MPSSFWVGGFQVSVAEPVAVATTWMLNAARLVLTTPSLTLILELAAIEALIARAEGERDQRKAA